MKRQSITLTEPNNQWLTKRVESNEYTSKSELVNDLIRRARQAVDEIEIIRMKLELAEKSGFTQMNREEILLESKDSMNG